MSSLLTAAVAGLTAGGAYALLGVCAVFTYRLTAIVNFTGAAIGAAGTFAVIGFLALGLPLGLATLFGVLSGMLAAVLVGLVMTTWFSQAPASAKAAATAAMLIGMIALGLRMSGGQHPHRFPELVPGSAFRFAGVEVTNAAVLAIGLAILFTVASNWFLMRTRTGLHLRALSERPMAAELLAVPVQRLSLLVWAVTGAVTTLALIIISPQRSPDFMSLSLLVVPAFAAALIGLFRSFWATLAGGIALGLIEGMSSAIQGYGQYRGAIPFIVILVVLLWTQREARWDEAR